MKAQLELSAALQSLSDELPHGIPDKKLLAGKVANLVAALEVFTDLNFTEEEQSTLFNISAQRLKELEEKYK
jgi:hypothetical protein